MIFSSSEIKLACKSGSQPTTSFISWGGRLQNRDVRDQILYVETETETQCNWSQFLILRLRLLKLVSNFETETETLYIGLKN